MCMWKLITEQIPKDNGIGYKVYLKRCNNLYNLFYYINTIRKLGETYRSKSDRPIEMFYGAYYPQGIHVFEHFNHAYQYATLSSNSDYTETVVKVRYSKVKAYGSELHGPVIVTDKITLLEVVA